MKIGNALPSTKRKKLRKTIASKKNTTSNEIATLLKGYWEQRDLWNKIFNQPTQPTVEEAYVWLTASDLGDAVS